MPGPMPDPNARRRNAPTIPTTALPASGRKEAAPKVPSWVTLGKAGRAWWTWAWKTPQAAAWAPGHEVVVARRASIEDDMAEGRVPKLGACREARELDDRLGLTPKGMAALRWTIVPDVPVTPAAGASSAGRSRGAAKVSRLDERRSRLSAADAP